MTRKGFTLIELLVVVLIIGILAAIAVPQYQKAVEKSKATQALLLLRSLEQAQTSYFLANGDYATSFDELPVDMSKWTGNTKWNTSSENVSDTRSNGEWSLQLLQWKTSRGLYMGRISGAYKGAGFIVELNNDTDIICAERFTAGLSYEKEEGSYCEKLFSATKDEDAGTYRRYKMP